MNLQPPRHDPYSTLEQLKRELDKEGYKQSFKLSPDGRALQADNGTQYSADQLSINKVKRLVNKENEAEKTTLYALSAADGTKGIVEDGYGRASSEELTNFMQKVESQDGSA